MNRLKAWAQALKRDVMTLWFALKHPQTPWYARLFAAIVTAYALSPVDLIPDFIPILGYLDDLILVPVGVWVLLRMVPELVLADSRAQAQRWFLEQQRKPRSLIGLAIVLAVWTLAAWVALPWFWG
jgi:uncharacterized membrane protein YkvA (DUF1232 family)